MADEPKLTSCTPKDVQKAVKKLGGFEIIEGARHTKMKHSSGHCSTIPRHPKVNKHLLRDFVDKFLIDQLGFTKEIIFKHLWC